MDLWGTRQAMSAANGARGERRPGCEGSEEGRASRATSWGDWQTGRLVSGRLAPQDLEDRRLEHAPDLPRRPARVLDKTSRITSRGDRAASPCFSLIRRMICDLAHVCFYDLDMRQSICTNDKALDMA